MPLIRPSICQSLTHERTHSIDMSPFYYTNLFCVHFPPMKVILRPFVNTAKSQMSGFNKNKNFYCSNSLDGWRGLNTSPARLSADTSHENLNFHASPFGGKFKSLNNFGRKCALPYSKYNVWHFFEIKHSVIRIFAVECLLREFSIQCLNVGIG